MCHCLETKISNAVKKARRVPVIAIGDDLKAI
jgi:hypothetical protein